MVLVDTSSWIETLRIGGNAQIRERISGLVVAGEAAWCDVVRLELWNGVRGERERRDLNRLESVVKALEIDGGVWQRAIDLCKEARSRGLNVQVPDLVIAATAQRHEIGVDSADAHVEELMKLK